MQVLRKWGLCENLPFPLLKRTGAFTWNRDHGRYTAAVSWTEQRHTGQIWHCVAHLREGQKTPWIAPKFILFDPDPILQHPENPGKPDGVPNIAYTDHQRPITKMFKIFQNESVALGSKLHDDKAGKCTGHLHLRKQRLGCFRKVNDWINSRNGDRRYH